MALHTYLPQDRLRALACGQALPDRTTGSALFADITGFTALTESLKRAHGERRGVEALSGQVNAVYQGLIGDVERFGGSVVGFAGDAITCWFDGTVADTAPRAAHCALAMQATMQQFPALAVKVAVSSGPARRFAVGDPAIQRIDVVAGATVARVSAGEGLALPGEILLDQPTASLLHLQAAEVRRADTGEAFHVLDPALASGLPAAVVPAIPALPDTLPDDAVLRPWILPFVAEREAAAQGLFTTDLRPAAALFLRFTGLDHDHDEHAASALESLVRQAQGVLQRHGGVLLELTIGDKGSYLYGSFGAAQVHEDDAGRALRAAVALRQLFAASPYAAQIGVARGTMRVGGYGSATRQSFGAMGDEVNSAARLMAIAAPGEILVSARVRHAVADEFTVEARPPMAIKGKAEPMPVFAVGDRRQLRAIRLQEPAAALPMVGRDAESRHLAQRLAQALQGQGRIVGITGEAGMGKSRLVAEGIRQARREHLIGYGGACQLDGIHTPYLAWQSIWTAFFDLDPALPLRKQIRQVAGEVALRAPEHAEAWPLLGAVLGLDLPDNPFTQALQPKDRKALLETLLLRCLASAAREAADDGSGLLLVLEDLHDADPLSLDLLVLVAQAIATLPVLLLLTWRPPEAGETKAVGARLAGLPQMEELVLGGLTALHTEQVIRAKVAALFPERPAAVRPALVERITQRAQGNPFYIEELLNYLHDRGIDPRDPVAPDALDLPASLHSLVLSRIDRLTVAQQLALKVASIIGRVFRVADLHGYYPQLGSLDALKADLMALDRLGLTPQELPEPDPSHLFKHLVTLEVSYESLAHATRVALHGRYARYLEETPPDRLAPLVPQLAHHYARAEERDKACHYLRRAGEQAAAAFANDEALSHFGRALDWLPAGDTAGRFDVLLRREAIHDLQGRHDRRRADLDALQALVPVQADPVVAAAQVATRRAKLALDSGDWAAARLSAQAAIGAIEADAGAAARSTGLLVDALLLDTRALFFAGEAAGAPPLLARALALARAAGDARAESATLSQTGLLHWHLGDYDAAEAALTQAMALARATGQARAQIDILNNLGVVAKSRSRHADAVGRYEQAQPLARRIGDRSGEAMLFNNMGSACLAAGDFYQAGLHAEQAARIFAALNEPTQHGLALVNRAEAHRELGQFAQAQALGHQALGLLRSSGFRRGEAIVLENLGLVEQALGHHDGALQSIHAALALAQEIGARATQASTLHHLGVLHTSAGRFDAAAPALDQAAALLQELGGGLAALEVQAAQAELALARGGPQAAATALDHLQGLLPLLLSPAPLVDGALLPMLLYRVGCQVLHACGDPRTATLVARARDELQARSARIPDAALRRGYLQLADHRAIADGPT